MNNVKFSTAKVVFQEIPDEITLAINLTQCPHHCKNCHSPELRLDEGKILYEHLETLVKNNPYITCVCFMGGDAMKDDVVELSRIVKDLGKKVAVYSGDSILYDPYVKHMDYYKLGPFREEYGPLNNPNTNQALYKIIDGKLENITHKFWRKNEEV